MRITAAVGTLLAAVAVIVLVVIGLVAIGNTGGESPAAKQKPVPAASAEPSATPFDAGSPERVTIDAIAVDAPVLAMGTAGDGSQQVPKTLTDTSWWKDGSHPGTSGNVVITGHAAHRSDDNGVFDDLGTLKTGDNFEVVGSEAAVEYTVTDTDEVDTADFADHAERIYASDGTPGAVLMTCGSWNGQQWETTTIIWATMSNN